MIVGDDDLQRFDGHLIHGDRKHFTDQPRLVAHMLGHEKHGIDVLDRLAVVPVSRAHNRIQGQEPTAAPRKGRISGSGMEMLGRP